MKREKPTIPKGTRDFGPERMQKRQYILSSIRKVFEKYGYQPMETPAMENLSVLTGKYGSEGDQLIYKVLNSGDYLSKVHVGNLKNDSKKLAKKIAEKGLRYDLTVPFARYVVMNQSEITFPFKRYQIQPVWRADRPQKGRYREFYQCDADVVGTDSLICESEIILMINEVMTNLGLLDYSIKVNHRKLLTAITEFIGEKGKEAAFCVAIDKLDKIGLDKVNLELSQSGFSAEAISKLNPFFDIKGEIGDVIAQLDGLLENSSTGQLALNELRQVFSYLDSFGADNHHVKLDLTLARGLSYYTGTILEVQAQNSDIKSSITGGGRYDDLTGFFGLEGVSGVGFSFGVDRIYDVLEDLDLFPTSFESSTKVLLINFDPDSTKKALHILKKLRSKGVKSEIFPDSAKMKKQMNYANKKDVPYVLMIGSDELETGKYQLKNMATGEQLKLSEDEVIKHLSN